MAFEPNLITALLGADVAAVLVRLADAGENVLAARLKRLAVPVQSREAALLVEGRPGIVARAGADGAHLAGIEAFRDALGLKPQRIVGCGGLKTRHDAMLAGEAGADYVMFGEPDDDRRPPFEAVRDRVAWWTEIFEIPCVGFAATLDEVAELARVGADFVAVDLVWGDPRGPAVAVQAAIERLAVAEAAQ